MISNANVVYVIIPISNQKPTYIFEGGIKKKFINTGINIFSEMHRVSLSLSWYIKKGGKLNQASAFECLGTPPTGCRLTKVFM